MKNNRGGRPSKLPFISPRNQRKNNETDNTLFDIGESSSQRAKNWSDEHKAVLVNAVREQFLLGNFVSGSPTSAAWSAITTLLNSTIGRNESKEQYKQAWKNIRAVFRKFEELSNKSGWGWDDVEYRPIVPDIVWEEYLKDHPEYKVCRFRPFPLFPVMKEILTDTYATGEFRRASNQSSPRRSPTPPPVYQDQFASEYQFVDDNNQFIADPMSTTPTSNSSGSKRNLHTPDPSQVSTARRRRQKTSLFHEEMKNAYLERNEILRMGFQQVPRAPPQAPLQFTIHDAVGMDLNDMIEISLEDDEVMFDALFPRPILQREMFTRPLTGQFYVHEILGGHEERAYNFLRMSPNTFVVLCTLLQERNLISPTSNMDVNEQVAIFIRVIVHSDVYRTVAELFQHSLETVSRVFHSVLHAILQLSETFIKMPTSEANCSEHIRSNPNFYPFFKSAIGAIDRTHVPAIVPQRLQNRFRNRKDVISQNVLAAVNFERQFLFVQAGWEGSAADMRVLRSAVEDRSFTVPNGKFFLADSGYANTAKFITPIRGFRYHISNYRTPEQRVYAGPEELYNHRHAQLRNVVERTFGIIKKRFRILTQMRAFKFKTQSDIVISCCVLHNFIGTVNAEDVYMNLLDEEIEIVNGEDIEYEILDDRTPVGDRVAGENLRNQIMNNLWNSFRQRGSRGRP